MTEEQTGPQLHDRATRGETLSEEEQTRLARWYHEEDEREVKRLGLDRPEGELPDLSVRIEASLVQIRSLTEQLHELSAQNDGLRRDILMLRREVAQRTSTQPA